MDNGLNEICSHERHFASVQRRQSVMFAVVNNVKRISSRYYDFLKFFAIQLT